MTILDKRFNVATLQACNRVLPCGFDVSADAPNIFEALKAHYAETGRVLVWSGASDQTIFGDPEINYAFRAWHDSRHITENLDFSLDSEIKVCLAQIRDLRAIYGNGRLLQHFADILSAEVIGQALYERANGGFPIDQAGFVRCYLRNKSEALFSSTVFGIC